MKKAARVMGRNLSAHLLVN